jgi:L-lactate dehydrogenase complex protein LldG
VVAVAVRGARAEILSRIRACLAAAPGTAGGDGVEVRREYRRAGSSPREEVVARFAERVADYRADVRRVASAALAGAVAETCTAEGARRLAVPPDLPAEWRPPGVELVPDDGLSPAALDAVDGVLTGCLLGIAETGTVVLDGGAGQGRRALTLVPDLHLCVVPAETIVELVPDAIERVAASVRAHRRPVTFVSGPSATSDIELSRVEGVHGPRRLRVFVVEGGDER